jgi:peptidoglycan/LPS O-acetylase OafA/YrhL
MAAFPRDESLSAGWTCFYALTSLGHQAVIVFFVLSGYLVGGSVLEDVLGGRFRWSAYFLNRVSRLYPALLLALIAGGLLDLIGLRWLNASGVYTGGYAPRIGSLYFDAAANLTWGTFAANLLMLETVTAPPLGTNGPLWSLAYEFWYYLLFPALILAVTGGMGRRQRILGVVLVVALGSFLPLDLVEYFGIWLLGAAVSRLGRPRVHWALAAPVCAVALAYARWASSLAGDYLLGAGVAALIWSLTDRPAPPVGRWHKRLAGFSYSLYITHFPLTVFLLAALDETAGPALAQSPGARAAAVFVAVLAAALAWGFGVSRLTEAHTDAVRQFLFARFGRVSPVSAIRCRPRKDPAPTAGVGPWSRSGGAA